MIIEPIQIEENGVTFNRLTHDEPFYACGYTPDKIVRLITNKYSEQNGDEILEAGTVISGKLLGFGSTDFDELLAECERRELTGVEEALQN